MQTKDSGTVSEWNEGNFKMMRLHKVQELMNIVKMNPTSKNEEGSYNYEVWFNCICNLADEGQSKYKSSEVEQIKLYKKIIRKFIEGESMHKRGSTYQNGKVSYFDNVKKESWIKLRPFIEEFEERVKLYNDKHGLSTRNVDDDGGI